MARYFRAKAPAATWPTVSLPELLTGDEIVAPGTRNPDRYEVFVISSGTRYKVIDGPAIGGGYY
jgi:hypothetical protein